MGRKANAESVRELEKHSGEYHSKTVNILQSIEDLKHAEAFAQNLKQNL